MFAAWVCSPYGSIAIIDILLTVWIQFLSVCFAVIGILFAHVGAGVDGWNLRLRSVPAIRLVHLPSMINVCSMADCVLTTKDGLGGRGILCPNDLPREAFDYPTMYKDLRTSQEGSYILDLTVPHLVQRNVLSRHISFQHLSVLAGVRSVAACKRFNVY